jgi:hypothetical protein
MFADCRRSSYQKDKAWNKIGNYDYLVKYCSAQCGLF